MSLTAKRAEQGRLDFVPVGGLLVVEQGPQVVELEAGGALGRFVDAVEPGVVVGPGIGIDGLAAQALVQRSGDVPHAAAVPLDVRTGDAVPGGGLLIPVKPVGL